MVRAGDVDDLLRRADLALHKAKASPSRSVVYTPDLQGGGVPLLVVELHRALERNEFVPFFQPIYRYDKLERRWRLAGAEALLRWVHPERGVVTPAEFIDLVMEMREHKVRLYTLRDTPIFTGIRGSITEVLATLG